MALKSYSLLTLAAVCLLLFSTSEGTSAPDEELDNLRDLLSGLRAHRIVLELALLPAGRRQFYEVLQALLELSELDEELGSLASELQDSLELAATRAVVKGVLKDSCNWMKLKIPGFGCTSTEMTRLKTTVDTRFLAFESYMNANYRSGIEGIDDPQWVRDNVKCEATEEVVDILNDAYLRFNENFSLDDC